MKKKRLRFFTFILIGFVLFTAFILIILSTSPGEMITKKLVENQLSKIMNNPVIIGCFETNIVSRIQLLDVHILQNEKQFVGLSLARVDYNLFDVLKKKIIIRGIQIDSLRLYILRDSLGTFQIPIASAKQTATMDTGKSSFAIQINELSLHRASLFYIDRFYPMNTSIHNLNIH